MLNVSPPAGFAELVERTATPVHLAGPGTRLDLDLFMRVATELGDVVLGPPGATPGEIDPLAGPHGAVPIHDVPGSRGDRAS